MSICRNSIKWQDFTSGLYYTALLVPQKRGSRCIHAAAFTLITPLSFAFQSCCSHLQKPGTPGPKPCPVLLQGSSVFLHTAPWKGRGGLGAAYLLHARCPRVHVHHQQHGDVDVFAAEEPWSWKGGTQKSRVKGVWGGPGRTGPGRAGQGGRPLPLCRAASSSRSLRVCTSVSSRFLSWTFWSRTTSFLRACSSLAAAAASSSSVGPALAMAAPLPSAAAASPLLASPHPIRRGDEERTTRARPAAAGTAARPLRAALPAAAASRPGTRSRPGVEPPPSLSPPTRRH